MSNDPHDKTLPLGEPTLDMQRGLMAMARCDVITTAHRFLIGRVIGRLGELAAAPLQEPKTEQGHEAEAAKGSPCVIAEWTRAGIANFIADSWPNRKHTLAEIEAGIRLIEVHPEADPRLMKTQERSHTARPNEKDSGAAGAKELRDALERLIALGAIKEKYAASVPDSLRHPRWKEYLAEVNGFPEREAAAWESARALVAKYDAAHPVGDAQ